MDGLRISKAPALADLTSIGLGGTALAEALVESPAGLEALPEALRRLGGRPAILGRGSNILAREGELPLVLIRLGAGFTAAAPELLREEEGGAVGAFRAPAGMPLPRLLNRLSQGGWSGLQGLVGIPGSVGGAVAMNAGSFGANMKSCLEAVDFYSPRQGFFSRRAEELEIGYRHFAVPGLAEGPDEFFLILGAQLRCRKGSAALLAEEMEICRRDKALTQPVNERSAGCVFKNHALGPAGRLLDEAGFKGRENGGMAFSALHANFLINRGGGRSGEAFELIEAAREAVRRRCGAVLELEVRLWE